MINGNMSGLTGPGTTTINGSGTTNLAGFIDPDAIGLIKLDAWFDQYRYDRSWCSDHLLCRCSDYLFRGITISFPGDITISFVGRITIFGAADLADGPGAAGTHLYGA